MSIKNLSKDSTSKNKNLKKSELEYYGIKIQCPDCGKLFILNEYGEFFCRKCCSIYTEREIRERCGL